MSRENQIKRKRRWLYQDKLCAGCGWELALEECEGHHLTPKRFGGTDGGANIVMLCHICHRRIHNTLPKAASSEPTPCDCTRAVVNGIERGE